MIDSNKQITFKIKGLVLMKKGKLLVLLAFVTMMTTACGIVGRTMDAFNNELYDVIEEDLGVQQVLKSVRGFGSDAMDVYRFKLDTPTDLEGFIELDEDYDKLMDTKYDSMIYSAFVEKYDTMKPPQAEDFFNNLTALEQDSKTTYRYIKDGKSMKYQLFIYNKEMKTLI